VGRNPPRDVYSSSGGLSMDIKRKRSAVHTRLTHVVAALAFRVLLVPRSLIFLRAIKFVLSHTGSKLRQRVYFFLDPNNIRKQIKTKRIEHPIDTETTLRSDVTLHIDLNDHSGFRMFIDGYCDLVVERIAERIFLDHRKQQGDHPIFLDIGANRGHLCVPICAEHRIEGIAVEASRTNLSYLARNIRDSGALVKILNCLLVSENQDDSPRFEKLHYKLGNSGASSVYKTWNPGVIDERFEFVNTETLDTLLSSTEIERIRLVKIDVEGSENTVLGGFRKLRQVDAPILLEWRIDLSNSVNPNFSSQVVEILAISHDIYSICLTETQIRLSKFEPTSASENIVALPRDSRRDWISIICA